MSSPTPTSQSASTISEAPASVLDRVYAVLSGAGVGLGIVIVLVVCLYFVYQAYSKRKPTPRPRLATDDGPEPDSPRKKSDKWAKEKSDVDIEKGRKRSSSKAGDDDIFLENPMIRRGSKVSKDGSRSASVTEKEADGFSRKRSGSKAEKEEEGTRKRSGSKAEKEEEGTRKRSGSKAEKEEEGARKRSGSKAEKEEEGKKRSGSELRVEEVKKEEKNKDAK